VQFWAPDDGRKTRLKRVQHLTEINKLWNVTSCWLYSAKIVFIGQCPLSTGDIVTTTVKSWLQQILRCGRSAVWTNACSLCVRLTVIIFTSFRFFFQFAAVGNTAVTLAPVSTASCRWQFCWCLVLNQASYVFLTRDFRLSRATFKVFSTRKNFKKIRRHKRKGREKKGKTKGRNKGVSVATVYRQSLSKCFRPPPPPIWPRAI